MSTLMIKRLSALPIGTTVQLSYGFMEGQNLMVTGAITDKDDSCMEIRDAQGVPHYVDFTAVKFFTVPSQRTQVFEPAPQPEKKLLHGQTIEHFSQRVSDYEMKNLFSALDKTEKRFMQTAYDSFCYGVKINSHDKRVLAAQTARKVILQEMANGRAWSREAFELAARMLSREGVHDWKLFDLAGMHDQAALCAFKDKQWMPAGIQAAKALAEKKGTDGMARDLMIVLETACIEMDDASGAEWLHGNGVDVRELAEDLILYKEKEPAAELCASLEMLPRLYSRRELISGVEQAEGSAETALLTGLVTKILWANSTGEITLFDGEQERSYPFRYSSVADEDLLEQIKREDSGFVQKKCLVSFALKNGEAVQIRRGQALLEQVGDELAQQQYGRACWYCRNALGGAEETEAMALMVESAVESDNMDLAEWTLDFVEDHREGYPGYSKAVSKLAQLYHMLHELEESEALTEEALKDPSAPDRLRAGILIQYCNYAMRLFNETGEESWVHGLAEKADQWLDIFKNNSEDIGFQKKHSKVLRWKIRGLLAQNLVEDAELVYGELVKNFPHDPKLKATSDLIAQTRQKLLERNNAACFSVVRANPAAAAPVEEDEEEAEDFQVPVIDTGSWADLHTSEEAFAQRVFSVDGEDRLAVQLTALRAGAMLNPNLKKLADVVSAAANDPLAEQRYDTEAMVRLLSDCDERFSVLNRYAVAAAYLRTVFQNDDAPLWLRRSILADEIPGMDGVCDCLEHFRRDAGQCADPYAAYRDSANDTEQREKADLMEHAQGLYNAYMASPAKDNGGRKFARFVETKALAHQGLRKYLEWVLTEDQDALTQGYESYRKSFLASGHYRISGEKVDAYIISNWTLAGRNYPSGDGEDLQGTRRNALRSSIRSILGVINDYYRWMERSHAQTRTDEGANRFTQLLPQLREALLALADNCRRRSGEADGEEQTGLFLLEHTARELLDKVDGTWRAGQERYLYADLLKTNQVELGEDFLPDFTGLLTGPLGLVERVFAHNGAQKLEPGEHISRIFAREHPYYRNFDRAELIRRYGQMNGQEVEMPHPERYIAQAKLAARLDFQELREALGQSGRGELEELLLWLYERCVRMNRFGYLAEGMELVRGLMKEGKGAAA